MRFKKILNLQDRVLIEELYKRGISTGKMRDCLLVHPYSAAKVLKELGYRRTKLEQVQTYKKHFGKVSHCTTFSIPELLQKFPEIKERLAQCA
jgi:hypothetical protein